MGWTKIALHCTCGATQNPVGAGCLIDDGCLVAIKYRLLPSAKLVKFAIKFSVRH